MSRILYFCPDFPQPSGGIKTLYRHVHRLCALGHDAYIVHQKRDFRATWHAYPAPVLWLSDRPQFGEHDVLVIPEVMQGLMAQTARFAGPRIVIALSWSPTYWNLKPGQSWGDFGISAVIAKSPLIRDYVEWSMGLSVTLFREYIDETLYYPEETKRAAISYLTRKDRSGAWLNGVFQHRSAPLDRFSWRPLQNLDETDYARYLRESQIYLVTHMQEGMNSSVLEAMACGCLVVGYSGVGGNVYMRGTGEKQNCILVENGNLPALGRTLEDLLARLADEPDAYDAVVANGLTTARAYQDLPAEKESLREIFG